MTRIEFSYGDDALLTCSAGTLRRHDGESTILDGPTLLDARWRADGSIVSIDTANQLRHYIGGACDALPRSQAPPLQDARIAPTDRYAALGPHGVFIRSFTGSEEWASGYGELASSGRMDLEASDDLRYLAVASETFDNASYRYYREEGRSWLAFDTRNPKKRVVDRQWVKAQPRAELVKLAFDGTSKRMVVGLPTAASVGAIRIGRSERYPSDYLGGARAVALDARGLLAAYAYPTSIAEAPRRLRVDYLERGAKGDAKIAITETLWIDPDLDDIVALAFDRASRRIACLGASGSVEIVPAP